MSFLIKKDIENIVFDIIVGLIPLITLSIYLGITLHFLSIYFLVVGLIYYIPLMISYILPKINVTADYIQFTFLIFNREIFFNEINSYSTNIDAKNSIFCKSSDNICIELNKNLKCIMFSPDNKESFINILNENKIPQKNSGEKRVSSNIQKFLTLLLVFFIISLNVLFYIFWKTNSNFIGYIFAGDVLSIIFLIIYMNKFNKKEK